MIDNITCCIPFLISSFVAPAPSSAVDIIHRVAEALARAETSYQQEVLVTRTYEDEAAIPTPAHISLKRSSDCFRYEGGFNKKNLIRVIITDGTDIWEYRPMWRHQYALDRLKSRPGAKLMQDLRDAHFRFFGRFLLLSKFRTTTIHERTATLKTRDGKHQCDVVRISPEEIEERSWEERLWIDAATGLVRKSVMKRRVMDENRARTEVETMLWERIALNGPSDSSVFRFTPPRNAILVEVFRPPAQSLAP